jgi:hypothetical protein
MPRNSKERALRRAARPAATGRSASGVLRIMGAGLMGGLAGLLIDLLSMRAHRPGRASDKALH